MKRAFTLIELLVVIAIIAILAAILFPVFAQAKEAAKSTTCLSNIKQIGVSITLYENDNDDAIPPDDESDNYWSGPVLPLGDYTNPQPETQIGTSWVFLLQPYSKSKALFYDPSFSPSNLSQALDSANCDGNGTSGSASTGIVPGDSVDGNVPNGFLSHYAIAYYSDGTVFGNNGSAPTESSAIYKYAGSGWWPTDSSFATTQFFVMNTSKIVEPARNAIVGDGFTSISSPSLPSSSYFYPTNSNYGSLGLPGGVGIQNHFGCEGTYRHKSVGSNYGFADTHAKYYPLNLQTVFAQDSGGLWYEKYLTYDR